MFLKRIEIFGFKSFADKTIIEFKDGITAILGPNGCGKSNIVDAFKWVLGEQSTRNMRAERMENVIFSGTENRKALGLAEVTLVISDEAGELDFSHPEITVKRRMFREGDSEYFLNGTVVRLKEIRELFFDTGVGKSSYSIMEQGRIDQVLSNRPEERRFLFEEAAGITKFIVRGNEAERKLQRTKENIIQAENILKEVERSYGSLKKQTEKTLEYRRLRDIIFKLDRDYKLLQWRSLEDKIEKKRKKLGLSEKEYSKVVEKINDAESTLANEFNTVRKLESRLIVIQRQQYGIDLEKENLTVIEKGFSERRDETSGLLQVTAAQESNAVESLRKIEELKIRKNSELTSHQDKLKELETHIDRCQKLVKVAQGQIIDIEKESQVVADDLNNEDKKRDGLQLDLRTATDNIIHELDAHLRESGYDNNIHRQLERQIQGDIEGLQGRIEECVKLLSDGGNSNEFKITMERQEAISEKLNSLIPDLTKLHGLFDDYRQSGGFLDEFLAPEGIVTKKRELDEKINVSQEQSRIHKMRIKELDEEKNHLSGKIQESREHLEGHRIAQAQTLAKATAIEDAITSLDRESLSEEKRLSEIRKQLINGNERIKTLNTQAEQLVIKRQEFDKKQVELRLEMEEIENGITIEKKKMAGWEESLKSLSEQKSSLGFVVERIRIEIEQIAKEIEQLLEDFRDRHSRELADFVELKEAINDKPKEIREALLKAKETLKSLGQVNLMAPEEFKQVAERYDFLCSQLEDLGSAQKDLVKVTDEIWSESKARFLDTYQKIRDNFHKMFRRLFGGGKAELRLIDQENPLRSGVEILAQPPGKKLENISLLSGGERALCGVAMMFATFLAKPSPFCILDEIDAALDEANIQRFTSVLADFGKASQFVVISHNKKTIVGAQNLLGVSMQESGVSSLLSLRLDGHE